MSNTTPRRPSAATMRAALKKADVPTEGLSPKALLDAFTALGDAPSTPAPSAPASTPKGKPAKATPTSFPLCGCGCGVPTVTAKARFLSGHDARWAGMVGRGEVTPNDEQIQMLVTPALQAKIDGIRQTAVKREAAKAARAAAKEAAKAAYAAAMASA